MFWKGGQSLKLSKTEETNCRIKPGVFLYYAAL